ncbi:MAG: MBG domain-containing protein [Luteolibacter sp.]
MRFHPLAIAAVSALIFANRLAAQESLADLLADPTIEFSRPEDRAKVVARMEEIENTRRHNARDRATLLGLPLRTESPNGRVQELADFRPDGRPLYRTTHNVNAAISTGANLLQTSPYSLSGSGINIGLWDGGSALSTHQEFGTRVTVVDGAAAIDHATHVAGTLIASGVDPAAHGMSSSATVSSYDWNNDSSEMTAKAATAAGQTTKIYLSNHSYGIIGGWNYVNGGSPYRLWEWYGSGTTSTSIETDFGVYNSNAASEDALAWNAPYYLIFRSAGNDRADNPASGSAVALSPNGSSVVTYNAATHPAGDGTYRGGFESISYESVAKNVLTVGSVSDAVTSGLRDPAKALTSYFSSWGPTDDGRIKPDVVANGENLYSSVSTSTTAYASYSGTSMASPNACGSAALLIQHYSNLFPGQAMRASTLKGLLIHTATDLGNPGPDYKYGWGLVNVQSAADLIKDHQAFPAKQRLTESQLTTSTVSRTLSFVWDGVSPISATLSWTDPAGTSTTTSDSRTARLVNNLNLKIAAPDGSEYFPFVMPFVGNWTQASMDSAAITGVNNTDNVEQVRIAAPPVAGTYHVVVSFSGSLTNSSQNYSLLLSGSAAQTPPPPAPPANLSATPGNHSASLTWSPSFDATSYNMKRSTVAGGPYAPIGSTVGTSYLDSPLVNGTTYHYVVSAINSAGEGSDSPDIAVIPAPVTSTTTLASSPGTSGNYGTAVTFTATVTGTSGLATGIVTFSDGTTVLGSGSLDSSGHGTYITSNLALGGHAISASYGGDSNYGSSTSNVSAYTVNPKPVTITGVTAANRNYDGTNSATLAGGTVSGVLSGETVTVVPGIGTFDSPNAGSRTVTATGYSISGANVSNYVLAAQPIVPNATIAPLPLQLTGLKTYDGTTTISANDLSIPINYDGTNLSLTGSAGVAGKDVGIQAISTTTVATRLQSATGNTGSNTASSFTVTMGATPVSGNTMIAVISTRGTSAGQVTSISQTGATWTRAAQATNTNGTTTEIWYAPGVSAASSTITINQASVRSAAVVMEYSGILTSGTLDRTGSSTGNSTSPVTGTTSITSQPNEVWIGGIGFNSSTPTLGSFQNSFTSVTSSQSTRGQSSSNAKVYALEQLVNSATATSSGGTLSTTAQWSGAIATFRTVMPGTLATAGPAAGNYTLAGAVGWVQVTPKPLAVSATALNKEYDGITAASLQSPSLLDPETAGNGNVSDGMPYTGDALILGGTPTASFINKHVGIAKPVIAGGFSISGDQAGNYTVTQPSGLTATITPRAVTVSAVTCTKVYDGSTAASSGAPLINPSLSPGDAWAYSQNFLTPNVSQGKEIIPSISIFDGNNGANYVVTLVSDYTGIITSAPATITLGSLVQVYDGTAKTVSATTDPADLGTAVTYDGSSTPPTHAGTYSIAATVTDPNYQGSTTGTFEITKAPASVALTGLTQTYDGNPKSVSATTTPADLPIQITYGGSTTPPTHAGTYAIAATVTDPDHQGSTSGSLQIAKAPASIVLTGLTQTYDGTPKSVSATSTPDGLAVEITYDGSLTAPTNSGTYAVTATITDPDYLGSTSGSLVISPANDWTSWQNTHFTGSEITAGLASDNDDPDSDGLPNLAEYALGADPHQFTPPFTTTVDETGVTLVFTRPANLPGITYIAEYTDEFGTWTPIPLELVTPGDPETLRAHAPLSTEEPHRRFLRLRFQRQ